MSILQICEQHNLHDFPLESLAYDFENESVEFVFSCFEEATQTYVPLKLIFGGVSEFSIGGEARFSGAYDCYSWRTEAGPADGLFHTVFFLRADNFELPDPQISLMHSSLKTEGGLSEEARADRAAYLQESGD